MIGIRIEFVAGDFHANPWQRIGSGREIEWPPSPWRLLRAVAEGWHRCGAWEEDVFLSVLDALAAPPIFDLPLASSGSSRHFVSPGRAATESMQERTTMLDSFLALDRLRTHTACAFVVWRNVEFNPNERRLLQACCAAIRFLGPAGSPCDVAVVSDLPSEFGRYQSEPSSATDCRTQVRRLIAAPALRGPALLGALRRSVDGGRTKAPLGARWVDYSMPADFGWASEQAREADAKPTAFPPSVLRFKLSVESGSLPPITETVVVAERMRQAAIKRHSALNGAPASRRLAGKAADGAARRGAHEHPFFLPMDLSGNGLIDAIDVWLPAGSTHDEFRALTSISRLWDASNLRGGIAVRFVGRVEPVSGKTWSSVTPIVLDRFPKRRGPAASDPVDPPGEQLMRALARRGLFASQIEVWNSRRVIQHRLGGQTKLNAFRRARTGKATMPPVVGATITFDRPFGGPLALGRLAHFGLGRFEPLEDI